MPPCPRARLCAMADTDTATRNADRPHHQRRPRTVRAGSPGRRHAGGTSAGRRRRGAGRGAPASVRGMPGVAREVGCVSWRDARGDEPDRSQSTITVSCSRPHKMSAWHGNLPPSTVIPTSRHRARVARRTSTTRALYSQVVRSWRDGDVTRLISQIAVRNQPSRFPCGKAVFDRRIWTLTRGGSLDLMRIG